MGLFDFIDDALGELRYHYVLEPDGSHRPARSREEFLEFMKDEENSRIASDYIGEVHVSTVFLGLDHSYGLGGPPLLFETMILRAPLDGYQKRTFTKEAALIEHAHALKEAQVVHKTEKVVGVDPAKEKDKATFALFIDGKKIVDLVDVKVGSSSSSLPWFARNPDSPKKGDPS